MNEIGKMIKGLGKGNILGVMEMCMNEIGKIINRMGKGNILSKMVRLKVATMRMGNSFSEGKR